MSSKNIEDNINESWEKLVVSSLRGTLGSSNGVEEIPLDLSVDFAAERICEKYFEKYNERISYEFRGDLCYFKK